MVILNCKGTRLLILKKVASTSILSEVLKYEPQAQQIDPKTIINGWKRTAVFIRNPVDRALSLWYNQFHELRTTQQFYPGLAKHGFYPTMSLKEFILHLMAIPDRHADHHFVSQTYEINQMKDGRPLFLGAMERMPADWAYFARWAGWRVPPPPVTNFTKTVQKEVVHPSVMKGLEKRYATDMAVWRQVSQGNCIPIPANWKLIATGCKCSPCEEKQRMLAITL